MQSDRNFINEKESIHLQNERNSINKSLGYNNLQVRSSLLDSVLSPESKNSLI